MAARRGTILVAFAIVGTGLLAISLVTGVLYERAGRARDREQFPQVGRSVDIGGRTLNIDCAGVGGPTVILESGSAWPFYTDGRAIWGNAAPRPGYGWVAIQRELASLTTTCWYDRAGSGWSDPGPYPRDSVAQARDLHALLRAAGVPPPYVLVAESWAALEARVYADRFPEEVAGVVLVNGVHPDLLLRTRPGLARIPRFTFHGQDAAAQIFNEIGLYRLGSNGRSAPSEPPRGITSAEWRIIWHLSHSANAHVALMRDMDAWERSTVQARRAGNFGDRPLIAISSDNNPVASKFPDVWMEMQDDLARWSTAGKSVALDDRIFDPIYEAPEAVVAACRQVLGELRQSGAGQPGAWQPGARH